MVLLGEVVRVLLGEVVRVLLGVVVRVLLGEVVMVLLGEVVMVLLGEVVRVLLGVVVRVLLGEVVRVLLGVNNTNHSLTHCFLRSNQSFSSCEFFQASDNLRCVKATLCTDNTHPKRTYRCVITIIMCIQ